MNRSIWLLSLIEAIDHVAKTHDESQECQDSRDSPAKYTGIVFMAEIKHKLPKPRHFGLGHTLCNHRIRPPGFSTGQYSTTTPYLTASTD